MAAAAALECRGCLVYLDEYVSHSRLAVAWVSLAGHNTNGFAIDLVVVEILQTLDSCGAAAVEASPGFNAAGRQTCSSSLTIGGRLVIDVRVS